MNDNDAMDYFAKQGRAPSFTAGGTVRGFRSRPGAPQATPPRGLTSGSNAMSATSWVKAFNKTGAGVQTAAVKELGRALTDEDFPIAARGGTPTSMGTGAAGPVGAGGGVNLDGFPGDGDVPGMPAGWSPENPTSGGIVEQTLGTAFGPGHWSKLVGRGPAASRVPDLYTPAPFMPGQQGTFRGAPKPLTGEFGTKKTDAANLASNRSMYEPGGMTGLWSRPRPAEKWQGPARPITTSGDFTSRYGKASVRDTRRNAGYGWGNNSRSA